MSYKYSLEVAKKRIAELEEQIGEIRKEVRLTWRAARDSDGQTQAFRVLERMVDRVGYGRIQNSPSLVFDLQEASRLTDMSDGSAERLAERFNETYELLAPDFGYETRQDTKTFDPESANGKLMIAVCTQMIADSTSESFQKGSE